MTEEARSSEAGVSGTPVLPGVPHPGEVIGGKYVCGRVLGAGGMGVVIAARHAELGQRLAVKLLLPEAARNAESTERFLREARAALEIRSEHVARVIDFGRLDSGVPYLVMEHLDGCDLKEHLSRDSPLPVESVVEFVIQACEAIFEAHCRGIVHRDLKPSNLFLTHRADGSPLVKVLDFGISKTVSLTATGEGIGITSTNALLGTPAYMSPEQLKSSKYVDHRTDLWSLGVILYELITGTLPFEGENIASAMALILVGAPTRMREKRQEIPEDLEKTVLRCLDKDPEKRFQGVPDLVEALLPFAPASSREVAGRITRMSMANLPFAATVSSGSGPMGGSKRGGHDTAIPQTASAWGRTQTPARRRSFAAAAGVALVAAILAAAAMMWRTLGADRSTAPAVIETPDSAAGAIQGSGQPARDTVPAQVPSAAGTARMASGSASIAEPHPVASTSSSGPPPSSMPPAVVPKAKPPQPIGSALSCEQGQVLSKGHCCPTGMDWQGSRCGRPLATDVPF